MTLRFMNTVGEVTLTVESDYVMINNTILSTGLKNTARFNIDEVWNLLIEYYCPRGRRSLEAAAVLKERAACTRLLG